MQFEPNRPDRTFRRPVRRASHVAGFMTWMIAGIFVLTAAPCARAAADDPGPLITDRPDVTESSAIVPGGLVQVEAGYVFSSFNNDGVSVDVSAFPSTLVRVGLDSNVELRFVWTGWISEQDDANGTDQTGSGNSEIGAKIKLRDERGAAPRLALLVDAVLPTGNTSFRADRIDPAVRLAGSNTLSDRVQLGWNVGLGALTVDTGGGAFDTHALARYSVSTAVGITDRWGVFGELFGFVPVNGPESPANLFDAGFTYLVSDTVQLDASAGIGLNDHADDWFFGAGVSFRLPH